MMCKEPEITYGRRYINLQVLSPLQKQVNQLQQNHHRQPKETNTMQNTNMNITHWLDNTLYITKLKKKALKQTKYQIEGTNVLFTFLSRKMIV